MSHRHIILPMAAILALTSPTAAVAGEQRKSVSDIEQIGAASAQPADSDSAIALSAIAAGMLSDRNAARITQHGTGHQANIRQQGNSLEATVEQNGTAGVAIVEQFGTGLNTRVEQFGQSNGVQVFQGGAGNGAAVSVQQY